MPSSNMQYYIRTEEGKEYGPVEQDVLMQWARDGRVTTSCSIRNSLVRKWTPAKKISFLEGIVRDEDEDSNKRKLTPDTPEKKDAVYSLNKAGKFRCVPAHVGLRFGAWLVDMAVILLISFILFLVISSMIDGGLQDLVAYTIFTLATVAVYLLYYAVIMGRTAQTLGQWFWGIMVVRPDGRPVLVGRACWFAICELVFGWSTLVFGFVLPSKRALQDLFSGIRVSRITVRDIAQNSL